MDPLSYNPDDPWHAWANFLFDFDCDRCTATVPFDWRLARVRSPAEDAHSKFLAACVEVAARARALGWTCVDGAQTFRCGVCSGLAPAELEARSAAWAESHTSQRTGAARVIAGIRTWFGRGPGR